MQPATRPWCWTGWTPALLAFALAACGSSVAPEKKPPTDTVPTPPANVKVDVAIQVDQDRAAISPWIYGSNQDNAGNVWTIRRYGGNRLTGYNWENNHSNAGSDWHHSSDDFLVSNDHVADGRVPAAVLTTFHDRSLAMGAASIVTLQMAGYVAADARDSVKLSETAPSARWVRAEPKKPSAFRLVPDTTDGVVYMDELVNLLVTRYGGASSARGVRFYSLDNEPALWSSTHPRIHPAKTGAKELIDRSIALASAVKAVDPDAGIVGPALYGMGAYVTLQDAPDWAQVKGSYRWFIDYYLAQMRQAEQTSGKRLLDALDVHWYPEAKGDHRIVDDAATTQKDGDARLQAPRTLWDPSYREDSWIAQYQAAFLPLLPTLRASIAQYYPGTKLAITEYDYGAGNDITGGLAQVDVLGGFGRYGVDIATLWGIEASDSYVSSAFKLYRDYDGKGGKYGATAVRASTSDVVTTSVYAASEGDATSTLHVMLVNKNRSGPVDVRFTITGGGSYSSAQVWGFDATGASIRSLPAVSSISGNAFSYTVPALSAVHLVLK